VEHRICNLQKPVTFLIQYRILNCIQAAKMSNRNMMASVAETKILWCVVAECLDRLNLILLWGLSRRAATVY